MLSAQFYFFQIQIQIHSSSVSSSQVPRLTWKSSQVKDFPSGSGNLTQSPPALKRKWAQIYCTATFLVPFLSAQFYFSQFALSLESQLDLKKKIWCNFYFKLYDAHIVRPFEVQSRLPRLYQKKILNLARSRTFKNFQTKEAKTRKNLDRQRRSLWPN